MSPELLSAILGLVMPFVVSFFRALLHGTAWPRWVAFLFAGAFSVLVGFLSAFVSGKLDLSHFLASSAYAFATAETIYNVWFKPAEIENKINGLVV